MPQFAGGCLELFASEKKWPASKADFTSGNTVVRGPHFELIFGRNGKKRREFPKKLRVTSLPT